MPETVKVICPNCDAVVAVAPESGLAETDLVCSHCGAALRGAGPLEKAAEKVKGVVRKVEKTLEDKGRPE